jgi:hypothetical protein
VAPCSALAKTELAKDRCGSGPRASAGLHEKVLANPRAAPLDRARARSESIAGEALPGEALFRGSRPLRSRGRQSATLDRPAEEGGTVGRILLRLETPDGSPAEPSTLSAAPGRSFESNLWDSSGTHVVSVQNRNPDLRGF